MTAVNLTAENVYVSKVVLNGREIDMKRPFVSHSGMCGLFVEMGLIFKKLPSSTELVPGGNLTFWMSNQATYFH